MNDLTEEQKKIIIASLLPQLWITLSSVPIGMMPNYEQAWDIAESVINAYAAAIKQKVKCDW